VTTPPTAEQRDAFYRAAVLGLRALDARESVARRFGGDADARWDQFAGALGPADRLDILLRDAVGSWGVAFSPAECFDAFGLTEDEPFGPDWRGVSDAAAKHLFKNASREAALDDVAQALGMDGRQYPIPPISPSTKLLLAGGEAVLGSAKVFGADSTLSWSDQVAVLSADPAVRQLAGLAAVLIGARARTIILRPSAETSTKLRQAGFAHLDAVVVSENADLESATLARSLGGR
jgi:hypothetical protein